MTYMSLTDSIRANGDRHKANAERHLAEGHLDYAAGSMRKAHRNYDRATEIDEMLRPKTSLEAKVYELTRSAIERNIFGAP